MSETKSDVLLEVKNLHKAFDKHVVLNDVNTTVRKGDVIAIIGPSGCGKSTFLRSLNMLETPTGGHVLFHGTDLTDKSVNINQIREKIGMVFQHFNLFPNMTIRENICLAPVKLKLMTKEEASKKADELLERVGLKEKADTYPAMLSGGQKQRVAIAGVVAMEPKCIVFDEPTAMLDPNGRKEVIATAHDLNKKKGVTIILITHYMEEVVDADYVYVMEKGKIVMDGTPRDIFSRVDELKEHRLDVPQATLVADELRSAGVPIPQGILTRKELVDAIMSVANA